MSIKRRLQYQSNQIINACKSLSLPNWAIGLPMRLSLATLVVLMGVMYIGKVNSMAAGSYEIHNLEKQVSVLTEEINKVNVAVAENSSLKSVNARLADLNMVQLQDIKHVNLNNGEVALK